MPMNSSIDNDNLLRGLPWEGTCDKQDSINCYQQTDSTMSSQAKGNRHALQRHGSEPIRFRLERSHSELQLEESERAAEYHDYCMYVRIVSGRSSTDGENREWLAPHLADSIRTREPYYTRSNADLKGHHDIDLEGKVSTPVLCNAPLTLLGMSHAQSMSRPTSELSRQLSTAEAIRSIEAFDDDRSIDEIFDFDP